MIISCPHCGFSKTVEASRIPERRARVTCPRCRGSFFRTEPFQAAPALRSDAEALPKAGFWIRVTAALLDWVAVTLLMTVMTLLLALVIAALGNGTPEFRTAMGTTLSLFALILSKGYYVFFTGYCGQTPGKMAVRIRVIRTDGGDIGYGRAFFREVIGKFVSGIILGIGYLMVAFDEQKQGLHDRMADTYVIKL